MKLISPRIHAYLDYVIATILILFHWIFGYELKEVDSWVPMISGLFYITYSILTRFRNEHFGIISLQTHLILDLLLGIFLIVTPWLGEFSENPPFIQSILGVIIMIIAGMTKEKKYKEAGNEILE
ncbi:SPW repeat domain-containing protein [Algoriphagus vanfongensis]|uniref:SPW repeat domain-containing protein n=1 Tax=Algoriphagus vanfongensis TaxID=426371 RepID=UPI0006851D26|nr:hypothetical protein [Algoriphagus vanfongensis]